LSLRVYKMVILNHNNISQYYCFFCIFDQIDAALVSRRDKKNLSKFNFFYHFNFFLYLSWSMNKMVILNHNNYFSQYYCFFCTFDQIDAALVSRRDKKTKQIYLFFIILTFFLLYLSLRVYKMVILNHNNISQYYCFFCIFDQINAALMSRRDKKN